MEINAKKKLGQNFLINESVITKIIKSAADSKIENVVEVGPGRGAITSGLVDTGKEVRAVEIDDDLIPFLTNKITNKNFHLIHANVLDIELSSLFEDDYILVANLPYYISTRIMFKFLSDKNCREMTIMLQEELADRIKSSPKSKKYGRLTVATTTFFEVSKVVSVPPTSFTPVPNVNSEVIKLNRIDTDLLNESEDYLDFIKTCFVMKRKTLFNNLRQKYNSKNVEKVLFEKYQENWNKIRSEWISVDEFKELYRLLKNEKH